MTLVTLVVVITTLDVVVNVLTYCSLRNRLQLLQDDVSAVRIRTVPVDVGGRLAPSPGELQAARNRMDQLGVAHPGGPA